MGHLFILRGDLRRLHCDAWLLSTDRRLNITPDWLPRLPGTLPTPPDDWGKDGCRSFAWPDWKAESGASAPHDPHRAGPVPWLTLVGQRQVEPDPDFYVRGALQFLDRAEGKLLALPLVGSGQGGGAEFQGALAQALVEALLDWVKTHSPNVALVCWTDSQLAACQQVRRKHPFPLTPGLVAEAQRLASLARGDRLALFLGAGVSQGAGLPGWGGLLESLAGKCGISLKDLEGIKDPLDQAQLLSRRHGEGFNEAVAHCLKGERYSLSHGLLACLPAREVITQNYDLLFELASVAAGRSISVIPYKPDPSASRWLLKMHGCCEHPEDIVLTRADFMRYSRWRAALAGMVQALLLTKHMLFVGFSLTDYNFHWIVDEVRQSRRDTDRFGTALSLREPGLAEELWQDDLQLVALSDPTTLQIFLDCVLAHAVDTSRHLLDLTFDHVLNDDERRLRSQLVDLVEHADASVKALPAWSFVAEMISRLGG